MDVREDALSILRETLLEVEGRGVRPLRALVDAPEQATAIGRSTRRQFEVTIVGFWDIEPGESDLYVEVTVRPSGIWWKRSMKSGLVVSPDGDDIVRYHNFPVARRRRPG